MHPWGGIIFPKRTSGAPLLTLSKLYDVYPPLLRQCIAVFAVTEGWLLLDIGWFVLFFSIIGWWSVWHSTDCRWIPGICTVISTWTLSSIYWWSFPDISSHCTWSSDSGERSLTVSSCCLVGLPAFLLYSPSHLEAKVNELFLFGLFEIPRYFYFGHRDRKRFLNNNSQRHSKCQFVDSYIA